LDVSDSARRLTITRVLHKPYDLLLQARVTHFPRDRLRLTFLRVVIRRHGEFQDRADRLDTEPVSVRINELD
jgi:hypothetical protein